MPDTSIVVTAKDNYSAVIKKMSTVTESFSKDMKAMEKQLVSLSRNKAQLKLDVKDAKQKLKETTEAFEQLGGTGRKFAMEMAQANYDKAVRNLNAVSKAAEDAEKHMSKVENRSGNGAGKSSGSLSSFASAISTSGFGNVLNNLWMNAGSSYVSSAYGDDAGTMASSILSSAAAGATMGMLLPGIGNVVGAIGGAIAGGIMGWANGSIQIFEKKDDFFKDYYGKLYEGQLSAGAESLSAGSTTAGSREQRYKELEKKVGAAKAEDYLKQIEEIAAGSTYGYDELLDYVLSSEDPAEALKERRKAAEGSAPSTYEEKKAELADVRTGVEAGYGTGYNEERKSALQAITLAFVRVRIPRVF